MKQGKIEKNGDIFRFCFFTTSEIKPELEKIWLKQFSREILRILSEKKPPVSDLINASKLDKSYRIFRFASKSQIKNLILADFGYSGVWQFPDPGFMKCQTRKTVFDHISKHREGS